MRQEHRTGGKLFVDYAGQTVPVIDRQTDEIRQAQIFVAVLGASSYTFDEATWSQTLPDWLGSHARCFAFLGGTGQILVPDNLRSGVTKAHRYKPDIDPSYRDLAEHYGVAVLPARSRKPFKKLPGSRRSAFETLGILRLDKLQTLRLHGMIKALSEQQPAGAQRLSDRTEGRIDAQTRNEIDGNRDFRLTMQTCVAALRLPV